MIINYFNYFSHLLIFLYLIHLSNCNWLRLGIAGIHLPDQDYIRQFSQLQSTAQVNRNQSVKRMHSVNDSASVHQHRINNKKSSNNNSLSKYFSYSDDDDVFVNDFIHKTTANVEYDSLLNQLNLAQLSFIKRNPNSLQVISSGTNIAIEQCALRFQNERWNCSVEDEKEVFGQTLKRANRESAFVQSIVSAGITYSITKACSTGNLENCQCDYRYERYSDIELNRKPNSNRPNWYWAGCSDNLAFGIKLAKQFLDSTAQQSSNDLSTEVTRNRPPSLRKLMNLHNTQLGREAIKKLMRLKCRCHGSSGSCQLKTCWRILPKFDEIGKYLKKKYQRAVRIEGAVNQGANFKLKRSRRSTTVDQSTKRSKASRNGDRKSTTNQNDRQTNQLTNAHSQLSSNKVLSFNAMPEIELNSKSFMVNNLNSLTNLKSTDEEEIDEDLDYDDEDDYFENDLEVEKRRLNGKANGKQTSVRKQANDNQQVNKQAIQDKQIGSSSLAFSHKVVGDHDRESNREAGRVINKQTPIRSNNRPVVSRKQQEVKPRVINRQIDEINIQFTNLISNTINDDKQPSRRSKSQMNPNSNKWSPDKSDLVYIHKSPNYCTANSELRLLGTVNRTCRKVNKQKYSDSCDTMCCGRGYDKRIARKIENCQCEFDIVSVQLKCKTCELTKEVYTCK